MKLVRIAVLGAAVVVAVTMPLDVASGERAVGRQLATPNAPSRRIVLADELGYTADVTADGRVAVVVTQPYGRGTKETPSRLEVRDLVTNAKTILAGGPSFAGTPGRPAAVFSPNAQSIVYSWLDTQLTDTGLLQVIGVTAGATPRTLIPADPSDIGIVPHAWAPDGKSILVLIHAASERMMSEPTSIAWVSLADGAVRTIKVFEPWRDGGSALPQLSRDGQFIAYSAVEREGSTDRHVYVIDAQGLSERPVATLSGANTSPVWTPDSAHVLFVNKQGTRSELFAVTVKSGGTSAAPVRLQATFEGELIRVSDSGSMYYRQYGGGVTSFIASPSAAGGRVVQAVSGYGAAWATANTLAFVRADRELVVRSLDTGDERAFWHSLVPIFQPRLLGDRSGAIVYIPPPGDNGRPGGSFYRVDFATGAFQRLFARDTPTHARSTVAALSPDNKTAYLGVLAGAPARWSGIAAVDLSTGEERPIVPIPEPAVTAMSSVAISPDGKTLAFYATDGRIMTMGVDGSQYRELHGPSPGGGWRDVMRWAGDGRFIVFATRNSQTSSSWRLMRIAATGGQAEFYGLESSILPRSGPLTSLDLEPGGSRVAVGVRTPPTFDVGIVDDVITLRR